MVELGWSDVFNLLTFVPYAVSAVATVSKSIGTIRAVNRASGAIDNVADAADDLADAADSIDDTLRSSQKTETAVGGGTGYLDDRFRTGADPLQQKYGAAVDNFPEEFERSYKELENAGVEIRPLSKGSAIL